MVKADRSDFWFMAVALLLGSGLILGVVLAGAGTVIPAFWVLLPLGVWLIGRKLFNTPYLSPTTLIPGIFMGVATFGYILREQLEHAGTRGASVAIVLSDEDALDTLRLMSIASTILIASSAIALSLVRKSAADLAVEKAAWRQPKASGWIMLAAAVPLIAIVANVGVADLIERTYYIVGERGSFVGSIGSLLATAAVLVVGYGFGAAKSGGLKFVGLALLVSYVALLLSYGSRRMAMIPILFALGVFIASNTRKSRIGIIIAGALSFVLLPLPLEFRSNSTHGIVPYMESFSKFTLADVDWLGALNNILVAFPIIGETAYGPKPVYASDIIIMLNPIPGADAGWYDIYQRLRLNFYTPMAGIGELGHVGWTAVVPFFIALGIFLAWMERLVRKQMNGGSLIFVGVIIAIMALFALQMLQYNLRSATRFLLYFALFEIARQVWLAINRRKERVPAQSEMERKLLDQTQRTSERASA